MVFFCTAFDNFSATSIWVYKGFTRVLGTQMKIYHDILKRNNRTE